jgi:hypothetical protein
MNTPTSKITEALVLESKTGLLNATTGNDQSLTKVVTVEGNLITIWHEDNKVHGQVNEEVVVIEEPSTKLKDDGTPFINYAIVPPAFAEKILANRK